MSHSRLNAEIASLESKVKKIKSRNSLNEDKISSIKKGNLEIKNLAKGVFTARDLVWQPPNILFPTSFANECKKLKTIGVKVTIYNEKQLL